LYLQQWSQQANAKGTAPASVAVTVTAMAEFSAAEFSAAELFAAEGQQLMIKGKQCSGRRHLGDPLRDPVHATRGVRTPP